MKRAHARGPIRVLGALAMAELIAAPSAGWAEQHEEKKTERQEEQAE